MREVYEALDMEVIRFGHEEIIMSGLDGGEVEVPDGSEDLG